MKHALSSRLLLCIALAACAHGETRTLEASSRAAAKAIKRDDEAALREHVLPGAGPRLDYAAIAADGRGWAGTLADPDLVRPEAMVFLAPDTPVAVVRTSSGWSFAEDPTDLYSQDTPRRALRALVQASRMERWDVLLGLAPRRYRIGMSEEDLERAWTKGDQGEALRAARDRLADHLADPIVSDAHEAVLDMGEGNVARLEREGRLWVVVDF
jgi:hypothetical protein